MTLPAGWATTEVRVGPYVGSDGAIVEGQVEFSPRPNRLTSLDGSMIVRRKTIVVLDGLGKGVVQLPVNDDPDISPTGWTWFVKERFQGGDSYDITVSTADVAAGVDLSARAPEPIVAFGDFRNEFQTAMSGLLAETEAARDEAAVITGLTGEDAAVSLLVQTPTSDTATALSAKIGAAVDAEEVRAESAYVSPAAKTTAGAPAPLPFYNVRDFGAIGDGTTDDTAALQSAITAAGVGGQVRIPPGRYNSGPLTLLAHQTIEGTTQFLGAGGSPATELLFPGLTGSQVGITGGPNNTVRNILLRGPGTLVGTCSGFLTSSGAPRFVNVGFYSWFYGVNLTGAYYTVFDQCEWSYNRIGVNLSGCYNVTALAPRFNCADAAGANFYTAFSGAARALNIYGGSIERYGSVAAIRPGSGESVNLFGVYFESSVSGSAAWGVLGDGRDKLSVTMTGCFIYLAEHSRFISLSGATNSTLSGSGNKFICGTASSSVPTAFVLGSTPTTKVHLMGDDWSEVLKAGTNYTDNAAALGTGGLAGVTIAHPGAYATLGTRHHIGRDVVVDNAHTVRTGAAATGSRPAASSVLVGAMFYDSTLGKPIWSTGSVWKDAAGTTV